jgi:hypothetical protein
MSGTKRRQTVPSPGEVWHDTDPEREGRQIKVLRLFLRAHERDPWRDVVYVLAEVVADARNAIRPQVGKTVQVPARRFRDGAFVLAAAPPVTD